MARRAGRAVLTAAVVASTGFAGAISLATPAQAAAPADCVGALYLTDSSNGGRVLRLGLDGTLDTTTVYDPITGASGNPNQLGIAKDGARIINTDRTSGRIVDYDPATGQTTATTPPAGGLGIAGAINPKNGLYYFGGYSGSGDMELYSYDPADQTTTASPVATIGVPNPPSGGTNGDITFDPAGNLYFVASSGTDFALYSFGGPAPANGTATRLTGGSGLGSSAVNGIAFGSDNFLYIGQSTQVRQVNPITGDLTGVTFALTGASSTDLASCAEAPSSLTVKTNVTGRLGATDEFFVTATRPAADGTTSFPDGTTTGTDTGLQNQPGEVAGPAIIFPARDYTISETASGTTDLSKYTSTWECLDPAGTLIAQGTGTSGTFTAPSGGLAVTCTFTNTPILPKLDLDKSVSPQTFTTAGDTLTYTFAVTNSGNADLSDLAIADPMPGLSTPDCAPVALGDTLLAGDTTTCTATYTVTGADITAGADKSNTATATGTPPLATGLPPVTSQSTATAEYVELPVANDDEADTAYNKPVTLPAVTDDTPGRTSPLVPGATVFTSADATNGGKTLATAEGTWQVNNDGTVTFTPVDGFTGTTEPVEYQITDDDGSTDTADLVVTVQPGPAAAPDTGTTPQNVNVTVDPLANDTPGKLANGSAGSWDEASVVFPSGANAGTVSDAGKTLTVPGEGIYTIDPATGEVTFDPEPQFTGAATAVTYEVTDSNGNAVRSTITITVTPIVVTPPLPGPTALPDTATTPHDTPVTVSVMTNDTPGQQAGGTPGSWDATTVVFTSPNATNGGRTLQVPGEGVYTIDPVTGAITFDPEPGFSGQATPVSYQVTDINGDTARSTLTITVRPAVPVPPVPVPPAPARHFDLVLVKRAVSGTQATVGASVRYKLTVRNVGTAAASGPIRLTDPLPKGLELVSVKGKGWKCTAKKASDTATCVLKKGLGAGRKASPVFVVVKATRAALGRVVNVAHVQAAGESVRSNNKGRAGISVLPAHLPATGFRYQEPWA